MVGDQDAIFEESLQCLRFHCQPKWGDRSPLDVFNRLLAKNIKPDGWIDNTHLNIPRHQVQSRREHWTTDRLGQLRRGHNRTQPKNFNCPIIIAEYEGMQRLLDGTTRINHWIAIGNTREHDVNIHTITGSGKFVELPSVLRGI